MQYFVFGLLFLAAALLLLRGYANTSPAVLARHVRVGAGSVALAGAATFAVRGAPTFALPLAVFGWWLIWGRGPVGWGGFPGQAQKSPGQASRVVTEHLEMQLDHDSGAMTGRVLKGRFQGRAIDSLKPVELAQLWQECRFTDPQSAQLLEAYLDRMHPTWREDLGRGDQQPPSGRMPVEEAWEILGLAPGASDEAIRRAHRELMQKLHPDRGGSNYLAAKINEAKDVLLEQRK